MSLKLGSFLFISVALTATLFLFQTSIDNIGSQMGLDEVNNIGFNYEDSNMKKYDRGGFTLDADITDAVQSLPTEGGGSDVDEGGNIFTDTFRSMRNWLLSLPGIRHVIGPLNAVPNFLSKMFPGEFAPVGFALGYIWYAVVIFSLVFWVKGGGQ